MTYNIHPIIVHFPIALLFIYSIVKILPLKRWFPRVAWRDIERMCLILGALGAYVALATGDTAEHLYHPLRQVVDAHSTYATLSTWLYSALLLGEIASIVNTYAAILSHRYSWILTITRVLERILCNPIVSTILVFAALIAIIITGVLGGVMVYGTSADPIAGFVLRILGITIT